MIREKEALSGIWGFPVTPFDEQDQVDLDALRLGVEVQINGGADVIVALGAVAEIDSLTADEWQTALETIIEAVAGRRPVLVTLPAGLGPARQAAVQAAKAGADALVVLPPEGAGLAGLKSYLTELAGLSQLGLILYQRGSLRLQPADLAQLVELTALIGLKDGQRDLRRFRQLKEAVGDRLVFAAAFEDMALAYWVMGADAFCPTSVIHDPAYTRRWYQCLQSGDLSTAQHLMAKLGYPLTDLRLSRPGISVSVIKEAMRCRGLPGGRVRPPALELEPVEQARVRDILSHISD